MHCVYVSATVPSPFRLKIQQNPVFLKLLSIVRLSVRCWVHAFFKVIFQNISKTAMICLSFAANFPHREKAAILLTAGSQIFHKPVLLHPFSSTGTGNMT